MDVYLDNAATSWPKPKEVGAQISRTLDDLTAKKPVRVAETKPYGCSVKYAR